MGIEITPQDILVHVTDPEAFKQINKEGFAEIVLRRGDKKFDSFFKSSIINSDSQVKQQVLQSALSGTAAEKKMASGIHKAMEGINLANSRLSGISTSISHVSTKLEGVVKLTQRVQQLSFINTGMSVANIAVDIAGFAMISNELNGLRRQIDKLSAEIGKMAKDVADIKRIQINEMQKEADNLRLDYNSFVDKIQRYDTMSVDSLEEYLKRANAFLANLFRNLSDETIDMGITLNILFMLLPAYTSILCVYLRAYYTAYNGTPRNYDSFLQIYEDVHSDDFQHKVQDYYFIDKGYDYREVIDILNVQLATVFNERLEIDDQLQLIEMLGSDENYTAFEKALDEAVKQKVKDNVDDIAAKCGQYSDECKRILQATA